MEKSYKDHLYALIICGGAGTRLWPRSRQKTPKQFLEKFYGEKTLFEQTVERAKLLTSPEKIFVVTVGDYVDDVIKYGRDLLNRNIIAEPVGRNTAMAVGVGAAYIRKIDNQAVIMNFWSDAAIEDNQKFSKCLDSAVRCAHDKNRLIAVGLKPTFPHTGCGYLQTGEKLNEGGVDFYKVNSFKEKPDLGTATEFLQKGNYYWNTGIYIWSAESLFTAFKKYSPAISVLLEKIYSSLGTEEESEVFRFCYEEAEAVSIDVAVSEKADNLFLITSDFKWSDIGDWKVAYDLKEKDEDGNIVETFGAGGEHLGFQTKNCLIETESKLVATIGISDLVIIETKDAILICRKDLSQDVKKIVVDLKERGRKDLL